MNGRNLSFTWAITIFIAACGTQDQYSAMQIVQKRNDPKESAPTNSAPKSGGSTSDRSGSPSAPLDSQCSRYQPASPAVCSTVVSPLKFPTMFIGDFAYVNPYAPCQRVNLNASSAVRTDADMYAGSTSSQCINSNSGGVVVFQAKGFHIPGVDGAEALTGQAGLYQADPLASYKTLPVYKKVMAFDPFQNLPLPDPSTMIARDDEYTANWHNQAITMNPGVYHKSVYLSPLAPNITLKPGIYYFEEELFNNGSNNVIADQGVTIIARKGISFNGMVRMRLNAPTSGPTQGIAIYSQNGFRANGSNYDVVINGVVYAMGGWGYNLNGAGNFTMSGLITPFVNANGAQKTWVLGGANLPVIHCQ